MDGLFRMEKMPSGLYIAVRPEDIFLLRISQSPGPILISRQVFVLARNRYNSGSSLYFLRGGSEIISSDAVHNRKSPEIINLLLSVIYCNLSLAGMQRLFRGRKYLSGLYADGTFREVFVSEQDMGHPDWTDPNFAAGHPMISC